MYSELNIPLCFKINKLVIFTELGCKEIEGKIVAKWNVNKKDFLEINTIDKMENKQSI